MNNSKKSTFFENFIMYKNLYIVFCENISLRLSWQVMEKKIRYQFDFGFYVNFLQQIN